MASSQTTNLNTVAALTGQFHDVYINRVKPAFDHISPMAGLFKRLGPGAYTMVGKSLVAATRLRTATGALFTAGQLPDHSYQDLTTITTTPARAYVRRAVDNMVVARGVVPGTFEDFMASVQQQAVEAFEKLLTRNVHGASTGTVCLCNSRASQTSITVKDGLGHTGMNPLQFLEVGDIIAWHDASNSYAVGGAAKISAITYSSKTLTLATNFDDNSVVIASGDPITFATTTSTSADYFKTERTGGAALGLKDILDSGAANSSYLGVTEATYPRIKPLRKTSSDFGEAEVMDFLGEIEAAGNSPVTSDSHVLSCQRAVANQYARTLLPFTQIQGKGQELNGGWTTTRIGEFDFVVDNYHTHNELMAHCLEDYFLVSLDGNEPGVWAGDGSEFQRLADFDGKEWFMKYYFQRFADRRNRSGTLTSITTTATADAFAAVPR